MHFPNVGNGRGNLPFYTVSSITLMAYFCLQATDADSDSNSAISFNLVSGVGAQLFHVEPDTGQVRAASSLADEEGSKFTLEVSASDGEKVSTNSAVVDVRTLAFYQLKESSTPVTTAEQINVFSHLNQDISFLTHACSGMSQSLPSVFLFFFFVSHAHANLCMHILVSIFQDGKIHFRLPDFRLLSLPVLNSVTDVSRNFATTLVT